MRLKSRGGSLSPCFWPRVRYSSSLAMEYSSSLAMDEAGPHAKVREALVRGETNEGLPLVKDALSRQLSLVTKVKSSDDGFCELDPHAGPRTKLLHYLE